MPISHVLVACFATIMSLVRTRIAVLRPPRLHHMTIPTVQLLPWTCANGAWLSESGAGDSQPQYSVPTSQAAKQHSWTYTNIASFGTVLCDDRIPRTNASPPIQPSSDASDDDCYGSATVLGVCERRRAELNRCRRSSAAILPLHDTRSLKLQWEQLYGPA